MVFGVLASINVNTSKIKLLENSITISVCLRDLAYGSQSEPKSGPHFRSLSFPPYMYFSLATCIVKAGIRRRKALWAFQGRSLGRILLKFVCRNRRLGPLRSNVFWRLFQSRKSLDNSLLIHFIELRLCRNFWVHSLKNLPYV